MATVAPLPREISHSDEPAGSTTAFIDRWIYVFMAALLIACVLIGFIPDSIEKIAAVERAERPALPFAMHVHAVLMGCWMLLLLAQTTLMATGRKGLHMQLGVAAMVLAYVHLVRWLPIHTEPPLPPEAAAVATAARAVS